MQKKAKKFKKKKRASVNVFNYQMKKPISMQPLNTSNPV